MRYAIDLMKECPEGHDTFSRWLLSSGLDMLCVSGTPLRTASEAPATDEFIGGSK